MTAPTKAVEVITPGQAVIRRAGDWNRELATIIRDSLAPGLDGKQLLVYSKICQSTGLDPFKRQIYAWIDGGRLTIHIAIGGWRAIAARTGEYAGQTPAEWCGADGVWKNVWLSEEPPAAARVGVYRVGNPIPTYSVATWSEFGAPKYGRKTSKGAWASPTWREKPAHMLAVRAEGHALQKACPEAYDQALGIMQEAGANAQVVGEEELPELPENVNVDTETGEITEASPTNEEPEAHGPPMGPPATASMLPADMEAEWGKLPKLMAAAEPQMVGGDLTPILGSFTKPKFFEWLDAEPGRDAASLVALAKAQPTD